MTGFGFDSNFDDHYILDQKIKWLFDGIGMT